MNESLIVSSPVFPLLPMTFSAPLLPPLLARCDHLRAMTSCTLTTGEQATGEQATGEQATREQTTGEQATGEQATSEQATAAVASAASGTHD